MLLNAIAYMVDMPVLLPHPLKNLKRLQIDPDEHVFKLTEKRLHIQYPAQSTEP